MHIFDYIAIGVLIALALGFALGMYLHRKAGSRR
jgi:uncharacterized protein YneF (UPF0154 family)